MNPEENGRCAPVVIFGWSVEDGNLPCYLDSLIFILQVFSCMYCLPQKDPTCRMFGEPSCVLTALHSRMDIATFN